MKKLNDVYDRVMVLHINSRGEPTPEEKNMVQLTQDGLDRFVASMANLKSCTVRVRLRMEFEVVQ